MRPVLEENELKPMVASTHVDDPVAFWKKNSADGEGREVLAAFLNILSTGYVKSGQGKDAIYIWPYLAEMDLTKLTPAQEVELFRIVPADKVAGDEEERQIFLLSHQASRRQASGSTSFNSTRATPRRSGRAHQRVAQVRRPTWRYCP